MAENQGGAAERSSQAERSVTGVHGAPPRDADGRDISEDIQALGPWFHNLHLPGGQQTAPGHWLGDFPSFKWERLAPVLPRDLTGWTALDIGCNAGFYTFELARRGAAVHAIDVDPHYLRQARWAAEQFGLQDRIEFSQMQVYDLARSQRRYDLVLFMGVLYHLRYPFLALEVVARCVGKLLAFQTLTYPESGSAIREHDLTLDERARLAEPGWPKMAFVEESLQGDPTNWWVPNEAAAEAMLRAARLHVIARPGHEIYLCEPERAFHSETDESDEAEYRAAIGG